MSVDAGKKAYLTDVPELLAEWDTEKNDPALSPTAITVGSNRRVWWRCKKGHSWEETVVKRTHDGKPCPYCTNKRVLLGYNDLSTLYPDIAKEWDHEKNSQVDINSVVPGSAKRAWWKCSVCGSSWDATIRSRTQRGTGCPSCARKAVWENRQKELLKNNGPLKDDLLLRSWDYEKNAPLKPEDVTAQSNKRVWWKCPDCEHSWSAKICNRSNGRGCPQCSNRALVRGVNDLATRNPSLAEEWDCVKNAPLSPSDVFSKSGKKYYWLCPNGHSYLASVLHRASGTGCPECNSGRQTSFAEQAVYFNIKKAFPDAESRYKEIFDNGMELDIYIPSCQLAIEYDGVFWHKSSNIERDRRKYNICRENNIHLIRIRESGEACDGIADEAYHMDNLDKRENLEKLIQYLLDRIDPRSNMWTRKKASDIYSPVRVNLSTDERLIRRYMTSVKNSLQDLHPEIAAQWHPTKNGDQTPSMFLCGSDYKAWWLCPVCGHEWKTSIGHRVSGTGCSVCYGKNIKDHHPRAKKVYQFTLDGEFIKEWNSASEAGKTLSISTGNISACLRHQRRQTGGYIWSKKGRTKRRTRRKRYDKMGD